MKRGATGLSGILAIDKPLGITSHDVVDAVRRLTGERRVGHAGTLDPLASGLMLVCVGPATRLSTYLTGHDKEYVARIVFGAATDTDDAEGRIVTSYTNKRASEGLEVLRELDPAAEVQALEGAFMQLPPAYSAIKKNGVTAYKAAREGKELELEARKVTVYGAELIETGFTPVDLDDGCGGRFVAELPYWDVNLCVSKGTYIRSIARDIGQKLGCGAHLGSLRRTKIAPAASVEQAYTLEELAKFASAPQDLPWADPVATLGCPTVYLEEDDAKRVKNGRAIDAPSYVEPGELVACVAADKLMALYREEGGLLKPDAVIAGGVSGYVQTQWGALRSAAAEPAVLAIGVFDGLHVGHRALLDTAKKDAYVRKAKLVALTFDKDPDEFFKAMNADGSTNRFKLSTDEARIKAISAYLGSGSETVCIPSCAETFGQAPQDFLAYLGQLFKVKGIHVGEGFRFGAKAAGDTQMLESWCAQQGATLNVHPLVEAGGAPVSATRIRELIASGDVDQAACLRCGVLHSITGMVVHGRGEGTDMGFATANLDLSVNGGIIVPGEGVYACWAQLYEQGGSPEGMLRYPAAVNMGVAKSFEAATAEVEAHILGFNGDCYGKLCQLDFVHYLRPQRKFDDMDELIATVSADIQWVKDNLGEGAHGEN